MLPDEDSLARLATGSCGTKFLPKLLLEAKQDPGRRFCVKIYLY